MSSHNDLTRQILQVFKEEETPLHAMVAMHRFSLAWLIAKIFRNAQGRPLRLLPFQQVAMDMLWNFKLPIYIACRGAGKCNSGNSLQQTSDGLLRFDEIIDKNSKEMTPIYLDLEAAGENGSNRVAYGWNNGVRDTKKICTRFGFEVECTYNHPIRVVDGNGNIVWKNAEDIVSGDTMPIVRSLYNFGKADKITIDKGWFLGATIGDGTCGNKNNISLTNIDSDIIREWCRIGSEWSGVKSVKRPSSDINYFINSRKFRKKLYSLGIDYCTSHHKQIPLSVRSSTKRVVAAFLSGLFDTDGSVTASGIEYSTASRELSIQVQCCLLAFGIFSKRRSKTVKLNGKEFNAFVLLISGSDKLAIFRDCIGFRCKRKQKLLKSLCDKKSNTNVDTIPSVIIQDKIFSLIDKYKDSEFYSSRLDNIYYDRHIIAKSRFMRYKVTYNKLGNVLRLTQGLCDDPDWVFLHDIYSKRYFYDIVDTVKDGRCRTYDIHIPNDNTFISNGFISHNSWLLGLYALTRAILNPGSEIVIVGAGLRQAMKVFSYIVRLYNQSPIIQEALREGPKMTNSGPYFNVGLSKIIALPIGDGEKIRGQRASSIICDEIASLNEEIFETVIRPFAAVHADPEERVFVEEFCDRILRLGADHDIVDNIRSSQGFGNQVILSGTASYEFNHFYKYYKSYEQIIHSGGDIDIIKKAMEMRGRISGDKFSTMTKEELDILSKGWKNYAILRMPYNYMPKGFLDAENIINDKATFTPARFGMEYETIFCKDSDGFIKRSVINDATPEDSRKFIVELYGDPTAEYVMGLDPARHNDNFGCIVLKLVPGGSRLVYADAWQGKDEPTSAKKIREIMSRFNIVRIAMDQGGGGDAVASTLALKELCQEGELPVYPCPDKLENRALLGNDGHFILDIVKWSSQWIATNAHALAGDISHLRILFPTYPDEEDLYRQYGARVLKWKRHVSSGEKDQIGDMLFGKENEDFEKIEEGLWDHIQATIDETCAIERTVTPGGVEKFELPNMSIQREGLDVRRRDRFSALVLAAYAARVYRNLQKNKMSITRSGGSPDSILRRRRNKARRIVHRGNVMY